jgi:two-component system copper resistance phosphate regulon response regulator CusR
MQLKLLLIEDDSRAAAYLCKGLSEAGFVVDTAPDGDAGLQAAESDQYRIILCDLRLPGRDGLSVIQELRRVGCETPIICVTARDEIDARVRGLESGADDYLVKPFAFAELLARIRALLRRTRVHRLDVYRVADLVCDPRTRRVERSRRRIDLTPKEFLLLQLLLEHAGEVVPRTLIAAQVWGMHFDSNTNVIDVQIRRLRTKIDAAGDRPLVHTVRGVGYVLEDRGDQQ